MVTLRSFSGLTCVAFRQRLALLACFLVFPSHVVAQGGQVRINNKTDQKITIKVTDFYLDDKGKRIDGPATWEDLSPDTKTRLIDKNDEKVMASVFRYVIITSDGQSPEAGKIWSEKYTSGDFLDVTINTDDLPSPKVAKPGAKDFNQLAEDGKKLIKSEAQAIKLAAHPSSIVNGELMYRSIQNEGAGFKLLYDLKWNLAGINLESELCFVFTSKGKFIKCVPGETNSLKPQFKGSGEIVGQLGKQILEHLKDEKDSELKKGLIQQAQILIQDADVQPLLELYLRWRQEHPSNPFAGHVTNSIGMKLVSVEPGKFIMGQWEFGVEETHEVEITKQFYVGAYEVTQAQYHLIMGKNPSAYSSSGTCSHHVKGLKTDDFPVETVSWKDAMEFCQSLTLREVDKGWKYDLPTEAEWEYTCRAGTKTKFNCGGALSTLEANFGGLKGLNRPTKVGSYKPNALGLYDMHGSVEEWCKDWFNGGYYQISPKKDPECLVGQKNFDGPYRVIRGGSWISIMPPDECESAYRRSGHRPPDSRQSFTGFRVVVRLQ